MPETDDEVILSLFKKAKTKEKAFEMLLKKYQRMIYYHTRHIVNTHEDADDVTQNVCIKIWNHLDGFRGECGLKTWIAKICINESLAFIEKQKRILKLTDSEYADYILSTAKSLAYVPPDEIQRLLQEAVMTLPPKQRAVFTARYYDETPYAELSEIFSTSESALKASYHFAFEKVKKYLQEHLTF